MPVSVLTEYPRMPQCQESLSSYLVLSKDPERFLKKPSTKEKKKLYLQCSYIIIKKKTKIQRYLKTIRLILYLGVWCSMLMSHMGRVFGWGEMYGWESVKLVHIIISAHPESINNHTQSLKLIRKHIISPPLIMLMCITARTKHIKYFIYIFNIILFNIFCIFKIYIIF